MLLPNGQRISSTLRFLLNGGLCIAFLFQIFVFASFSLKGHCQLYAPWCQWIVNQCTPDTIKLTAQALRVTPNGQLQIIAAKIQTETPITTTSVDTLEINLSAILQGEVGLQLQNIQVELPSASGKTAQKAQQQLPIPIESLYLKIKKSGPQLRVQSIAAVLGDWQLRGAITLDQLSHFTWGKSNSIDWQSTVDSLNSLFTASQLFEQQVVCKHPVIQFDLHQNLQGNASFHATAHIEEVLSSEIKISQIELAAQFNLTAKRTIHAPAVHFKAHQFNFKQLPLPLLGESISALWQPTAGQLKINPTTLTQSKLKLNLAHLNIDGVGIVNVPNLQVQGLDAEHLSITGTCFFEQLANPLHPQLRRLKGATFATPIPLNFCLDYAIKTGTLKKLTGELNGQSLQLKDLEVDRIRSKFTWDPKTQQFDLHDTLLQRDEQWIQIEATVNAVNHAYRLALKASAIPTDYNSVMPSWWTQTFRDFRFFSDSKCTGDFEILGTMNQPVADFFYGSVQAHKLAFRGVDFENGSMTLRGRQHYSEIVDLVVNSGLHLAKGSIQIAFLPDSIKAPLFWSLDLESSYPLPAYQKLVNANIAKQIAAFNTKQAPKITFQGKFFGRHYPQYREYLQYQMEAKSQGPIQYGAVPLTALQFELSGNSTFLSIYKIEAALASGRALGQVDFNFKPNVATLMNVHTEIEQCDTKKILRLFEKDKQPMLSNLNPSPNSPSKLTATAHFHGPTHDWHSWQGYGQAQIKDKALGSIKILGPLSSLLQNTPLSFTSLKFRELDCNFALNNSSIDFETITISGKSSRINMKGSYAIRENEFNMDASLHPLINYADKINPITPLNQLLQLPFSSLLRFKLDGSLQKPRWRSIFDPRMILPAR